MAKKKTSQNGTSANDNDDLALFFAKYPQFDYNPHGESWSEYSRLVQFFGWKNGSKKERPARNHFRKAIVGQFTHLYGADENKLDTLQLLCEKIRISPIPNTITSCKAAISKVHVNIIDFVDSERTGNPVPTFSSFEKFRDYTLKHRKIFPKEEAKSNSLLRYLLRPVFAKRRFF
ncbi:hypothetical protein ACHAQJ_007211 [Trichoderma viride]